jgi:hypothetical protein
MSPLAALFSSFQRTFARSFQSPPGDPMQTLPLHQSRSLTYGNLLKYFVFWKICEPMMPLFSPWSWESHFCKLASLSWQQRVRNHRWRLHQMSRHDETPSYRHVSHGCGHLPLTTRRPGHKRVFAWTCNFGSSQQGGFANKRDGFKLHYRRTSWLP